MQSTIERVRLEEVIAMPKVFNSGVLYVSQEFETASHLCCCGCGTRIVTPLGFGRWRLTVADGKPSLSPSIGNTSLPCRSHYFIRNGKVVWAQKMTDAQHLAAIAADRKAASNALKPNSSYWSRFINWIKSFF